MNVRLMFNFRAAAHTRRRAAERPRFCAVIHKRGHPTAIEVARARETSLDRAGYSATRSDWRVHVAARTHARTGMETACGNREL